MRLSKKGQITIFIAIGLIIVILAGFMFYVQSLTFDRDDTIPEFQTPVQRFVSQCLADTARDAIVRLGMQGGYIDLPESTYRNPRSYIQELSGGPRTPLWLYNGQMIIPSERSVEGQISEYVNQNIGFCLQGLGFEEGIRNISITGTPVSSVMLTQTDVVVELNYTVSAVEDGSFSSYDRFATRVPVALRDILAAAAFMTEEHHATQFLDRTTMNIISMDSSLPIGSIDFSCRRIRWSKREVQSTIEEHLQYLIPRVRVRGTDIMPFQEQIEIYERIDREWDLDRVEREGLPNYLPDDMYEYIQQYWTVSPYPFNGLGIGFSYFPEYGMRMEVNPSSGDRMQANPGRSSYLRFLCVNIYHFTYDIEYPVRMTIFDSDAFGGDGYSFNVGLPVTITRNTPTRDPVSFALMEAFETDEDFCSTQGTEVYLVSQNIFSGEYNAGVNVTYDCIRYYCELGDIGFSEAYGIPQLRTHLPLGCVNGLFVAEKEGFLPLRIQVPDAEGLVHLDLVPLRRFNVDARRLTDGTLHAEYTMSIFLESYNYDYEVFAVYPSEGEAQIELINGPETYYLELFLTYNGELVGGWMGNWTVTMDDLMADTIIFRAYEQLPHPQTNEQRLRLFEFLDDDLPESDTFYPYRETLQPLFR